MYKSLDEVGKTIAEKCRDAATLKRQHGHRHLSSSSKSAPYHSHQFMVGALKVDRILSWS